MSLFRPAISLLCVLFLVIPPVGAQTTSNFLSRVTNPYRPREVAPVNLSNSNRLESLVRAGILYLSLQDTIALALAKACGLDSNQPREYKTTDDSYRR